MNIKRNIEFNYVIHTITWILTSKVSSNNGMKLVTLPRGFHKMRIAILTANTHAINY